MQYDQHESSKSLRNQTKTAVESEMATDKKFVRPSVRAASSDGRTTTRTVRTKLIHFLFEHLDLFGQILHGRICPNRFESELSELWRYNIVKYFLILIKLIILVFELMLKMI